MDKKTKNSIQVGAFVSLGLLIFIAAIYYLGAQKNLFGRTLEVTAIFSNVEGLQAGNNVQFSGIKVGTVKSVTLVSDSSVRVTLMLARDVVRFIRQDATATIGTEGLMGNKVVSIAPGTAGAQPLAEGDVLATRQPASFDALLEVAAATGRNAEQITTDLAAILGEVRRGRGTVGRLLQDTALYGQIESTLSGYQQTGRNAARLAGDLQRLAGRVERGEGTIGRLINDDALADRMTGLLDSLETVTGVAAVATRQAATFTRKLNDERGVVHQLLTDTELARNAHATVVQVQQTAADFEETAERVNQSKLFGWLFRRRDPNARPLANQAAPAPPTAATPSARP